MSIESEITVGTKVIVKVGRNEVEVTVTEITEHGWKVKSQSTGREFEVRRIERIVTEPVEDAEAAEPETAPAAAAAPETETAEPEPEEEDNAVDPAPESESGPRPEKKLSLLNAAAKVLAACRTPMNCKEMIAKAVEMGSGRPPARRPRSRRFTAASSGKSRPPRSRASRRARPARVPSSTPSKRLRSLHRQPLIPRGFFVSIQSRPKRRMPSAPHPVPTCCKVRFSDRTPSTQCSPQPRCRSTRFSS